MNPVSDSKSNVPKTMLNKTQSKRPRSNPGSTDAKLSHPATNGMKILGIDPGSTLMGFGLIERLSDGSLKEISSGTTNIKETLLGPKLFLLNRDFRKFLREHKPDIVGVETLFFSKNKKTALEVAHARGVILLAILDQGIPLVEYTPGQIKQAVTNYGSADKKMVKKMVELILKTKLTGDDNASDALAVAITTASYLNQPK